MLSGWKNELLRLSFTPVVPLPKAMKNKVITHRFFVNRVACAAILIPLCTLTFSPLAHGAAPEYELTQIDAKTASITAKLNGAPRTFHVILSAEIKIRRSRAQPSNGCSPA